MNNKQNRKLAAILFADIVGYTALMQSNEPKALAALHKFKTELESQVPNHKGEIIQFYGDGCLVVFNSSVDAVTCAKKLQLTFQSEPKVPVRIGLHAGDVVFKEANVFGDAVNIASRVESMGVSGAVLLSSNVRNQIKNQPDFDLVSLGRFEFKNVVEGMTVYALKGDKLMIPKRHEIKGKLKTNNLKESARKTVLKRVIPFFLLLITSLGIWYSFQNRLSFNIVLNGEEIPQFEKTIAVLPFRDLSPQQNQAYFADGIVESIRSKLAQIGNLRVTSMTSVLGYRDNPKPIGEIAKELKVTHILEGTVYKDKERVRVIAQLIFAATDEHLWTETYDGVSTDIFELQSDIAINVAKALKAKITPESVVQLNELIVADINAYDIYFAAVEAFNQYQKTGDTLFLNQSYQKCKKATQVDPNFPDAYTLMGEHWYSKYYNGKGAIALDSALYYTDLSLSINPNKENAYVLKGYIALRNGDFEKVKILAEKALEISPSNAGALLLLSRYYRIAKEPEKEIALQLNAIAIDPQNQQSPKHHLDGMLRLAWIYHHADMNEKAEKLYLKALDLYPNALEQADIAYFYFRQGKFEEALNYKKKESEFLGQDEKSFKLLNALGLLNFYTGRFEEAEKYFRKVQKKIKDGFNENPYQNNYRVYLAAILWQTNRQTEAKILLNENIQKCLKDIEEGTLYYNQEYYLAIAYDILGDKGKAYQWLEKIEYVWWIPKVLKVDVFFESMRNEERFKQILEKGEEQVRRYQKALKSLEVQRLVKQNK